ncbi:TetR family transcriptional regulator [Conexibacter woesei]|uniref:Transcriptional regulator, TetR family n=1 Tax=Conexibacter woesei (strain DSM 14684 / CCUG 47730 / CIP 108061 / JCM 11494 / NBRC 100937 / ID131577) TaxID=469383 RepID=D3F1N6_CONWI|nr:TetR family transcriptional regulator [Conexibacter woesei]ADB54067.1 transcriptional regulator, TetR family [Conexibacter woesei DSM 14684]
MNTETPSPPRLTRREQKERTRNALLDAALRLLEQKSFGSLGLREVAREAGVVPTAFYRHFDSMEELGLVLIDDSFRTLRQMIRAARAEPQRPEHVIRRSVEILVRHIHEHRLHFRFIARERSSGVPALRQAIRTEIRLFSSELAIDLARFPYLDRWPAEDLGVVATLIVNTMVSTAEGIIDAPTDSREGEDEVIRQTEKQLLLIALGISVWRSP